MHDMDTKEMMFDMIQHACAELYWSYQTIYNRLNDIGMDYIADEIEDRFDMSKIFDITEELRFSSIDEYLEDEEDEEDE